MVKSFKDLNQEIIKSDIVIVATGADDITVNKSIIANDKPLLILDLSIPSNVDSQLKNLDNVTLVNLDELSQLTNAALNSENNTFLRQIPF